jgi:hypothetical protein
MKAYQALDSENPPSQCRHRHWRLRIADKANDILGVLDKVVVPLWNLSQCLPRQYFFLTEGLFVFFGIYIPPPTKNTCTYLSFTYLLTSCYYSLSISSLNILSRKQVLISSVYTREKGKEWGSGMN